MRARMQIGRSTIVKAIVAVLLAGVFSAYADRVLESTWDSGLDGWVPSGSATVVNESGTLKLTFPAQTAPEYSSTRIVHQMPAGYRPNHISFRFKASELRPSAIRLCLMSTTGRSWYKSFELSGTNQWMRVNAIVDIDAGWSLGPVNSPDDFEIDMNSVTNVALHIVRNGTAKAHDFHVDDFIVDAVATGGSLPADNDADGMLDAWEIAYGLDPGDASDATADTDGDGLSNLHEYIAGTDPRNALSALVVGSDFDRDEPNWLVLNWTSVLGREYRLMESKNLIEGFSVLESGILATPPVNYYLIDTADIEGAIFYKVEVE